MNSATVWDCGPVVGSTSASSPQDAATSATPITMTISLEIGRVICTPPSISFQGMAASSGGVGVGLPDIPGGARVDDGSLEIPVTSPVGSLPARLPGGACAPRDHEDEIEEERAPAPDRARRRRIPRHGVLGG